MLKKKILAIAIPLTIGMLACGWYWIRCQNVQARSIGYSEGFKRGVEIGTQTAEVQIAADQISAALQTPKESPGHFSIVPLTNGSFSMRFEKPVCLQGAITVRADGKLKLEGTVFYDPVPGFECRPVDPEPEPKRNGIVIYPFHRGYADIGFPLKPPPISDLP